MIAGAVLAGGGGTRLGGVDKSSLVLGPRGETSLGVLLARLRPQAAPICISTGSSRPGALPYPAIQDAVPDAGPLGGVAACLAWAAAQGADALLTVPVDTPFIPPDLAARLHPAPSFAAAGERDHHLCALWPVMSLPVLAGWLAEGHTRVREFLALSSARRVVFADPRAFHNINTPADLEEARRLLRSAASGV